MAELNEKDLNEVVGGAEDHNIMLTDVAPANIVGAPNEQDEQLVKGAVLPLL